MNAVPLNGIHTPEKPETGKSHNTGVYSHGDNGMAGFLPGKTAAAGDKISGAFGSITTA